MGYVQKQKEMKIPVAALQAWRNVSPRNRAFFLIAFDQDSKDGTGIVEHKGLNPDIPIDILFETQCADSQSEDILKWLYGCLHDYFDMEAIDPTEFRGKKWQASFDERNEERYERGDFYVTRILNSKITEKK